MHRVDILRISLTTGKSFPMLMEPFPILPKFPHRIAPWKKGLAGRARGPDVFYYLAKEATDTSANENFSQKFSN
jgi:hypothetical protein